MARHLKTQIIQTDPNRGAYVSRIDIGATDPNSPKGPQLVLELFDVTGRRVFVRLTDAQVQSVVRTGQTRLDEGGSLTHKMRERQAVGRPIYGGPAF